MVVHPGNAFHDNSADYVGGVLECVPIVMMELLLFMYTAPPY